MRVYEIKEIHIIKNEMIVLTDTNKYYSFNSVDEHSYIREWLVEYSEGVPEDAINYLIIDKRISIGRYYNGEHYKGNKTRLKERMQHTVSFSKNLYKIISKKEFFIKLIQENI